jgi:hypothetical protein
LIRFHQSSLPIVSKNLAAATFLASDGFPLAASITESKNPGLSFIVPFSSVSIVSATCSQVRPSNRADAQVNQVVYVSATSFFTPVFPPNKVVRYSVPQLRRASGLSPVVILAANVPATGNHNHPHPHSLLSFSLPLDDNALNAVLINFHPKKINPPVTARFPTHFHVSFCSGDIFV